MRKTLSLRPAAERAPTPARTGWNVSDARRKRLKDMAQTARRHPTDAQKLLWTRLAAQRAGGFKFHRQVVIGSTIVAFACPARWLVVEIAGKANAEVEAILDRRLSEVGVRVMRFTESQIMNDLDTVIDTVVEELNQPFNRRDAVAANGAAARGGAPVSAAYAASSNDAPYEDDGFEDGFDVDAEDDDADVDENVFDAAFETSDEAPEAAPSASDADVDAEDDLSVEDQAFSDDVLSNDPEDALFEADDADAAEPADVAALFDSRDDFADAEAEQAAQ